MNLFIGLTRGSRLLSPHSKEFLKFGYEILYIERELPSTENSRICPDLVLGSRILENTIFFEFTHADISKKLKTNSKGLHQLDRYQLAQVEDLSSIIPREILKSFDVPFVVEEKNFESFINFFKENVIFSFPLLKLTYKESYVLELIFNSFSKSELTSFFAEQRIFNRIPDFLTIDPSDLSNSIFTIFNKCNSYLIQTIQRSKRNDSFTSTDLAVKIFGEEFWEVFDVSLKQNLLKGIEEFLNKLLAKFPLLNREYFIIEAKGKYRVILSEINRESNIQRIFHRMSETTKEIISPELFQLKLFDDTEYYD